MNTLTKKTILFYLFISHALFIHAQVTWPVQCASGDTCDTHNMLTGFGDGAPGNAFHFHEGIDILGSGNGGDKVIALRTGILYRRVDAMDQNKGSIGDATIIKVDVGGFYEYDVYNHIENRSDSIALTWEDDTTIITKGEPIGIIYTEETSQPYYASGARHVHISTLNSFYEADSLNGMSPVGVTPIGENLLNPFLLFNDTVDRDPQLKKPSLEDNNQTSSSANKTVLFQKNKGANPDQPFFNTPTQPIFSGVNILAEAFDSMTTTLRYNQGVHAIGYWVKNLTGNGQDVKTPATPYMLARFDNNWFRDNPFLNMPSISPYVYQQKRNNPTEFDAEIDTFAPGRVLNHYIVSHTKGTDGHITNVDALQFWKTNAKAGGSNDNGSDAATACVNEEAIFKDGKYEVHIVMEDIINKVEDSTTVVIVDNFLPYVKRLTIKENTIPEKIIYDAVWEWNTTAQQLCLNTTVSTSSNGSTPLTFTVEASEPLQSSTVNMTIQNYTVSLNPTNSDQTIWENSIAIIPDDAGISLATHTITIKGTDQVGHPLWKLNPSNCYTINDLPKRYAPGNSLNDDWWKIGTNTIHGPTLIDTEGTSHGDDNAHKIQLEACSSNNQLPLINNSTNPTITQSYFCFGSESCLNFIPSDPDGYITMVDAELPLMLYQNIDNSYDICWEPTQQDIGNHFFEVTVFDDCGASTTKIYNINVECETFNCPQSCPPPTPCITQTDTKIVCSTNNASCGADNGTVNILTEYSGSGYYSYIITLSDDINDIISSDYVLPISSAIPISGLSQGDYIITITDEGTEEACQISENFTIEETLIAEPILSGPLLYIPCGPGIKCLARAVDITVYGGSGDYTYYWPIFSNCDQSSSSCDGVIINKTVTVVDKILGCTVDVPITYNPDSDSPVTINFPDGACSEPGITVNPVPCQARLYLSSTALDQPITATFAIEDKNVKDKEQRASVYITARHQDGKFETAIFKEEIHYNKEYTTTFDPTEWPEGAYTFELNNSNGDPDDCPNPDPIFGFVPCDDISASISKKNSATCSPCKGKITVTPSGGTGTYNYSWLDCPTCNTPSRQNLCAGTYYVVIADTDDCVRVEDITLDSPMDVSYQTGNACNGNTGSIDLTVTGGSGNYFYAWQDCDNLDCNSPTQTDLGAGQYVVTIFDQETNCYVTQVIEIEDASGSLTLSHKIIKKPQCSTFNCGGQIALSVTGGSSDYSYQWSSCGGFPISGACTASSYSNLCKGNYTVTVTETGCTAVETIQLDCITLTPPTFPCLGRLAVHPNPFQDYISLAFGVDRKGKLQGVDGDKDEVKVSIELTHISGKPIATIYESSVKFGETNKTTYNTSRLPVGKYVITVYYPCGKAVSETIVKL